MMHKLGSTLAVAPFAKILLACDSPDAPDLSAATEASDEMLTGGWATGGTASMRGPYPDPFEDSLDAPCVLSCRDQLGPCYAPSRRIKDVSDGKPGLPVHLTFLVMDESCKPIQGADIDIWHTSFDGLYSGNRGAPGHEGQWNLSICNPDRVAEAMRSSWFRGTQTSDATGRIVFETCYPGWYSLRTIHIHGVVRIGTTESLTTQFYFDDALNDEIMKLSPYNSRGPRGGLRNSQEGGTAMDASYRLAISRMSDGSLLASKRLIVRRTGKNTC
ncbi:protocatechuate 3,4-dioxygenase [Pendulispora rubella]|uniref:Protocatechuate 3,4-dioxygenase n=1 Tax=Pendulispora rubella TaxID=2741070 RepID=A0ABZ2KRU1_9BACT